MDKDQKKTEKKVRARRHFIQRERPRVLIWLSLVSDKLPILELAQKWNWDLVDLEVTRGAIPSDKIPRGALVSLLPTDPIVKALQKNYCPIVRVGFGPHPKDHLLPAVLPDLEKAGKLAADHFMERGFQYVAYIGSSPWGVYKPIHDAFTIRCEELGISPLLFQIEAAKSAETVSERNARFELRLKELTDWIQTLPKPVAVLCGNDLRAARACIMCTTAGVLVPEDVAILGIGNERSICEMSPIPLSSIDTARDECVIEAARLLHNLMEGEKPPEQPIYIAPNGVISRRSTEVLACSNHDVVRALRFIWDHFSENIAVYDVAKGVGTSRRTLERAFHEHLKSGVNEEIRKYRLKHCCKLLEQTNMKIRDIVPLCGFHSADYLHVSFRKKFSMTPRQWRMQKRIS